MNDPDIRKIFKHLLRIVRGTIINHDQFKAALDENRMNGLS
jgi:hypothetical protein